MSETIKIDVSEAIDHDAPVVEELRRAYRIIELVNFALIQYGIVIEATVGNGDTKRDSSR